MRRLAVVITACLTVARLASAQPSTGSILGTVTGEGGLRLPAVEVTVRNQLTGAVGTSLTDADGRYRFGNLPVEGEYEVRVAVPGFAVAASETVTLVSNAILVVNFRLKLTITGSVNVSAESPRPEGGASAVQQAVSEELVRSLPLNGRNFIPLAALTAGFTGNPNAPSPLGQMFWTNNVIVDGASHFSKWRSGPRAFYSGYGLEAIKEVQVLTSRFSAEYGDALATVTRVVTRSGTDSVHGSGLLFVQNNAFNDTPAFAAVKPPGNIEQFGFTLGGPVGGTRTHIFESYEGRYARNKNIVVSPLAATGATAKDDQDEHLLFFRVDHQRSEQHQMMVRYNGQFFRWHNEPGGLVLPGTGTMYTNNVHTLLGTDRRRYGRILSEFRAQFARYVDVREDLSPSVFVSRAGYSQEGGILGAVRFGANPEDTWEAANTFSLSTTNHAIRFGTGAKYVRSHNPSLTYSRGAYFFAGAPAQYPLPYAFIQGFAPTPDAAFADPRSVAGFGFIQDDWRIRPGLTLSAGVRYDLESVSNVRNYSAPADKNNVQPRLGLAWEPFGNRRTVVRGGFGIYTQQQLLYYINRAELEGNDGIVTLSLVPSSSLFPTFPNILPAIPSSAPARDIQQVDTHFRNPYSLQASGGVEHVAGTLGTISVDWVWLNGRDLMSLIDVNAPTSVQKPAQRSVAQADATRPIPALPGQYRNIVTLGNLGRSWYHALQIKGERSLGDLQSIVSYTFSRAEDLDNYQLPEDSRNLAAEKALADAHVRHNLRFGLTWQLPSERPLMRAWTLSGIGSFQSGRPYTITWGDDRNGTSQNDARPGGRNTATTGTYQNIDLALSRRFVRGPATIDGRIEAFDVLNRVNYDQYVGVLLSPLYRNPISAFPTRRFQLALVARF